MLRTDCEPPAGIGLTCGGPERRISNRREAHPRGKCRQRRGRCGAARAEAAAGYRLAHLAMGLDGREGPVDEHGVAELYDMHRVLDALQPVVAVDDVLDLELLADLCRSRRIIDAFETRAHGGGKGSERIFFATRGRTCTGTASHTSPDTRTCPP